MKIIKRNMKTLLIIAVVCIGAYAFIYATGIVTLSISTGSLTISADQSSNISINVDYSGSTGNIEIAIATGIFAVEDKDGLSGYYTTIQAGTLNQESGTGSIPASYISFKAGPVVKLLGSDNASVKIGSGIDGIYGNIDTPKTYFYKKSGEGSGLIGRYSDYPTLKITVPPYTASGAYQGKLYYILKKY